MTDVSVTVTANNLKEMEGRYLKAKEIEKYLEMHLYVERFNRDNFHAIRCIPMFSDHNFDERNSNLYQV